ncbi:MAG TPA: OmpH family outer membrane protein [Cyclobacteriaceae bacterium]|nr:OmpH family outer membrane protein [Cyclobacteriaceae bacterium]
MNRLFLAVAALFVSLVSFGQDVQKLGYADTDYILTQLPDAKKVETDLEAHYAQLESQLKSKAAELDTKMKEYEQNYMKWIPEIRADKENDIRRLQENLQKFQQDAEASYQKKSTDLLAPIYEKVGKAIAEVSKENGYSFIMALSAQVGTGNILLYKDSQFDVSALVLKKLGVTPTAAVTTPKPQPK